MLGPVILKALNSFRLNIKLCELPISAFILQLNGASYLRTPLNDDS